VRKTRYSGFAGTTLDAVLRERDIRYLQAGPPAAQQATLFNVESFFGWTLAAESLIRSLRD
jgi:hypothetical protein